MPAPGALDARLSKWFHLDERALRQIKASIGAELELGLRDEEQAAIKMLITYVRELSRGDEIGSYLALDLGGTHFRVLLVTLNGDGSEPRVTSVTHDIPQAMLVTKNGRELFDYIALKLLEFVKQYKLKRRRISLGFTFSFPCKQYGLTQSVLVKWCKGFNVGEVVGTDVVRQLKDALKRQLAGLVEAYIDVVAVINDTTGTLVACANKHKDCRIGLIVGTGFNACYMETLDRCEKWPANYTSPKQVIINCEWGAMGDHRDRRALDQYRNDFDLQIDRDSVNPLNQTYEKMVAGMYVGELLRLAMLELVNQKLLFAGCAAASSSSARSQQSPGQPAARRSSPRPAPRSPRCRQSACEPAPQQAGVRQLLGVKDLFNGRHLSMLAKDELAGSYEETDKILRSELKLAGYTLADMAAMVRLGAAIMNRSASLVACGVSALLERMQRKSTVVGYDGSVAKYHPYFLQRVVARTAQLTPAEFKFEFVQSSDGSGIGAAVVAAALHKERRPLYVVRPGRLYEMHLLRTQQQLSAQISLELPFPGTELVGSGSSRASSVSTGPPSPAAKSAGAPAASKP